MSSLSKEVLTCPLSLSKEVLTCPPSADNPKLIVTDEIEDGGTVEVTCILPIDYTGGDCRLYREDSLSPLRVMTARSFLCVFHLTSAELLGRRPVGSRIYLKCDYHLQQYTSAFSDIKGVTVSGTSVWWTVSCMQTGLVHSELQPLVLY